MEWENTELPTEETFKKMGKDMDATNEALQKQMQLKSDTDHNNGQVNIAFDTTANLGDLAKNLAPLQGWVSELNDPQKVTKGIRVVDTPVSIASSAEIALAKPPAIVESASVTTESTTASEKIPMKKTDAKNTMHYGEKLAKKEYATQVQNVLGTTETDPKKLRDIIGTLQDQLKVKKDRALGPNTFDALQKAWDNRPNKGQDYKTFINELITGKKAEQVTVTTTEPTTTQEPTVTNEPVKPVTEVQEEKDQIALADYTFELEWSLMTLGIERNANTIQLSSDSKMYKLNINAMGKDVIIDTDKLANAIKNGMPTVEGTIDWSNKPVNIIINKRINEKTPFNYDQAWLDKGIISQGNVNYNFELKKWDLKHFGTDPDVSSITEKDGALSFNAKDNAPMTLSKEQFEAAVKVMNDEGKSSTKISTDSGTVIINKEKGEWKKPDATASYDARNTTANNTMA